MAYPVSLKSVIKGRMWSLTIIPEDGRVDFYLERGFKANGLYHPDKGWLRAGVEADILESFAPALKLHAEYLRQNYNGHGKRGW